MFFSHYFCRYSLWLILSTPTTPKMHILVYLIGLIRPCSSTVCFLQIIMFFNYGFYFCLFFHVFKHLKSKSYSFPQLYCYFKFLGYQPPPFLCVVMFLYDILFPYMIYSFLSWVHLQYGLIHSVFIMVVFASVWCSKVSLVMDWFWG